MICPVSSFDWHVFNRVLHPHVVLKFLFPVTNTDPHSRAHFAKSQGSGSAVLVVVRLLVVVVRVVLVCVEVAEVVTVAVVLDSVTDVVVSVTVVLLDLVDDVPVELVTDVTVVAVTVLVKWFFVQRLQVPVLLPVAQCVLCLKHSVSRMLLPNRSAHPTHTT